MKNSLPINLIALGSYGREEMSLHSDIDLMLLYTDVGGYNSKKIIEEFLLLIWDCGLKLGHRVHDVKEIVEVSQTDITIKTAFIESRLIHGSSYLYVDYINQLKKVKKVDKEAFVTQKVDEHKIRIKKYPLRMECNLKDGYGGLREANTLFWIVSVMYEIGTLKDLVDKEFDAQEYALFKSSFDFIVQVRNALHIVQPKKNDLLVLESLPAICELLNIKDTKNYKKERILHANVLDSLHHIHRFCTVYIDIFAKRIKSDKLSFDLKRQSRVMEGIYQIENIIYVASSHQHKTYPNKSSEIKQIIHELLNLDDSTDIEFSPSYIHYLSRIQKIKLNDSNRKNIIKLFSREHSYQVLRVLYDSGVLMMFLPHFKNIKDLPQFDGYHIHPADIHSLRTLYHVENIKNDKVQELYDSLSKEDRFIVKLVALFHDIGKGRGKDHHIEGQNIFKKIAQAYNINEEVSKLALILIRHHDQMSRYAQKEDIYSQKVVLGFISKLQSLRAVKLLYIVTYADMSAVDPKIFTTSMTQLMNALYKQSIRYFEDSDLLKESIQRTKKEESIKKNKKFAELSPMIKKKIFKIESNYLFYKLSSLNIISMAKKAYHTDNFTFEIDNTDHLNIKIIRTIPINLGFLLGKLSNFSITSMNIFKLFDSKKYFEINFEEKALVEELAYIEHLIIDSFDMQRSINLKKPQILPKEITVDTEHSQTLASIKLATKDQKGLFAYIAKVFDEFNVDIESAKIITQKRMKRVNDLIIVDKDENFLNNIESITSSLTSQ